MRIREQWDLDSKFLKAQVEHRTRCKRCGCTRTIPTAYNRQICRNCGHYIFRNDKEEFIYRMKERINNDKRNSKNNASKE